MTTQTSNSPGERLSRFFDAAGVIAVSLRSQSSPEGPSPMERVGKALGKTALMLTAVVGAGAYGAIQHRMSDSFHEVPLDQAILEVSDTGPGVDPADLTLIFDRFYRGRRTAGASGSGIGLAVARELATAHGGTVTARNAATGGAVFIVALPAVPTAA